MLDMRTAMYGHQSSEMECVSLSQVPWCGAVLVGMVPGPHVPTSHLKSHHNTTLTTLITILSSQSPISWQSVNN